MCIRDRLEAIAGLQHTESGSDVKFFAPGEEDKPMAVSYTHLDVYKRQLLTPTS